MTQLEDDRERVLLARWHQAERNAKRGDRAELVELLRHFSLHPNEQTHEMPNLDFVANVLDGTLKRPTGRPPDGNLLLGIKKYRAAKVVDDLVTSGLTLEDAVADAVRILAMSDSSVKKYYLSCKKAGLLEPSDDSALLGD